MTNPPGLRANPLPLVVVGNPKRRKRKDRSALATSKLKDPSMATATKGKRAKSRKRRRAAATKSNPAKAAARATKRSSRKKRSRARVRKSRTVIVSTGKAVPTKVIRLNPGKRGRRGRRRARRNPDGAASGFLGDITGALGEAGSLTSVKNAAMAAGGAVTSMLAGAVLAPQVAKYVPTLSLPMARIVNGLTYAVAGIAPAVFFKDRAARRRWILGALGMAISEALVPGWSSDLLRRAPVVGSMIPVPQTSAKLASAAATLKGLSGLGDFLKRPIGGAFSAKVNQAHLLSADGTIPTSIETNPDTQPDRPGPLGDLNERPGALGDPNERPGALGALAPGGI